MQALTTDAAREQRLRRHADRHDLVLRKSRIRGRTTVDDFGGYMLVDARSNVVVCGLRWDLDLDDVEEWLRHLDAQVVAL